MIFTLDARIPVVTGRADQAGPDDVVLAVNGHSASAKTTAPISDNRTHPAACACCAVRTEAGRALAGLLHDRARGKTRFFRRVVAVVATEAGRAELLAALADDPVAGACFRLDEWPEDPRRPGPADAA